MRLSDKDGCEMPNTLTAEGAKKDAENAEKSDCLCALCESPFANFAVK